MDLVKHIDKYPLLKKYWNVENTPETMKRIADITDITDPIYYVGAILPRPLLIITALKDEIIPRESSEALIEASHATNEQIIKYDTGHTLHPNVVFDIRKFFLKNLGKQSLQPN